MPDLAADLAPLPDVPGLAVTLAEGVLTARFDRPEVYNAIDDTVGIALAETLEAAQTRGDVRVVVLTGTGAAFSTGADISGENAHERFDVRAMEMTSRFIGAITRCDRPVVAAVNGIAAGVGCSIALACDLVLAAESASFLLAFTRIGFMPDGGTSATVAASIGRARAMRMALLAEPLPASEAFTAGLVSHLVPDADLADETARLARRLAGGPPLAFAATKKAITAATLPHLDEALERELTGQSVLMRTADVAEGMAAFGERRRPVFRGE
ncbi:enoyl-CoA hydratase-related protein [Nocardioides acrostichi]|uniref:Enoyl-CoA hydratase/isomerase family protein n=1 Tax=Nocardioides acrostichi TaxID=2784339 RepID=A0A930UXH6_9ACTN|nr:enoyl-CoA hydratase-related protein [Nocardioides acrostichi]MBF4160081.1 enoyl-CoA hydratase/isomerase family protein [Nocardioides acrostichi]